MFDSHILYLLYDYASIATINKRRKKDKNKLKIANLTPSLKYRKRNIHKKKKICPRVFDRWHWFSILNLPYLAFEILYVLERWHSFPNYYGWKNLINYKRIKIQIIRSIFFSSTRFLQFVSVINLIIELIIKI